MPIAPPACLTRFITRSSVVLIATLLSGGVQAHEDGTQHVHTLQIAQSTETESQDKTVAVINGVSYSEADLRRSMSRVLDQPGASLEQLYPMILEQFIIDKLLTQSALDQGYADDPRVETELERAREAIANNFFISDFLEKQITEDMVIAEYQKSIENLPDSEEVLASHILVASADEATDIIAQLSDGADFATLAKENSTGPSGANGGSLGYFGKGQMVPAFEAAVFELEVGDFTRKPVQTQFGYHVILLEDKRVQPKPTLAEMRDQLHQQLSQNQVQTMIEQLKSGASVERYDLLGNVIAPLQ